MRKKKDRVPDTYYINNDYANITTVYEDYVKFRTSRKHKKRRKTKKLVSKRVGRTYRLALSLLNKIMITQ